MAVSVAVRERAEVAESSGGRIPALDGIRGLAILLVLMCHFAIYGGMRREAFIDALYYKISVAGWSGVDLFFVLSGFLITGILVDAKGQPHYFRDFYMRRVLRIFPIYYAVLALFFFAWPLLRQVDADYQSLSGDQWWYWTYLANVKLALDGWPQHLSLGHFWSLAVEEQFYLMWPAIVFFTRRHTLRWVCLGCILAAPCLRVLHWWLEQDLAAYVLVSSRMDALALGGLLALVARRPGGLASHRGSAWAVAIASGGALASIGVFRGGLVPEDPIVFTLGFSLLACLFGALLTLAVTATPGSWLERIFTSRPLALLGRYSYGLYVFHHIVIGDIRRSSFRVANYGDVLGSQLPMQFLYILVSGAIIVAISVASWHLFEAPILRLKSRFRHSPASAA